MIIKCETKLHKTPNNLIKFGNILDLMGKYYAHLGKMSHDNGELTIQVVTWPLHSDEIGTILVVCGFDQPPPRGSDNGIHLKFRCVLS